MMMNGRKSCSVVEPENVMHYMTERELIWRATKIQETPLKTTKESGVYVVDERGSFLWLNCGEISPRLSINYKTLFFCF